MDCHLLCRVSCKFETLYFPGICWLYLFYSALSVEDNYINSESKDFVFRVFVRRKNVYTVYIKCVYQSENIQWNQDEFKKKQYGPVGLRQSWK